jgi:hypothetical protein
MCKITALYTEKALLGASRQVVLEANTEKVHYVLPPKWRTKSLIHLLLINPLKTWKISNVWE